MMAPNTLSCLRLMYTHGRLFEYSSTSNYVTFNNTLAAFIRLASSDPFYCLRAIAKNSRPFNKLLECSGINIIPGLVPIPEGYRILNETSL